MSRTDIVGYTLAEIAFALLFAIAAVFLPTYGSLNSKLKVERDASKRSTAEVESLKKTISELEAKSGLLPKAQEDRQGLRSKQLPSCIEKGAATTWLFSATAISANKYVINNEIVTFDQLRGRFGSELAVAEKQQCRHSMQLLYAPGMAVSDYNLALRKMGGLFYVQPLGPNQTLAGN